MRKLPQKRDALSKNIVYSDDKSKFCSYCFILKDIEYFYSSKICLFGVSPYCKSCNNLISREAYHNPSNDERNLIQRKKIRVYESAKAIENRKFVTSYLLEHPCIDCGQHDIEILEFDHIDRSLKKYNVSALVHSGRNMQILIAEINKCEVRCCNCHRKKTNKEFKKN